MQKNINIMKKSLSFLLFILCLLRLVAITNSFPVRRNVYNDIVKWSSEHGLLIIQQNMVEKVNEEEAGW